MNNKPEEVSGNEADADLLALQRTTAEQMGALELGQAGAEEEAVESVDIKEELSAALKMAFQDGLGTAFPSVKSRFDDKAIDRLASTWAAVFRKYGWAEKGIFGEYAPELFAAFVTAPMLFGTVKDIQHDLAVREQEELVNKRQPTPAELAGA